MKKIKTLLGLLFVTFIALVIYQNKEYFFAKQAFSLDLGVETWKWTAQEVKNVYYYGGCFLIGLVITGYLGLFTKFRAWRAAKSFNVTIKDLNTTISEHLQTIVTLQAELDVCKKNSSPNQNADKSDDPADKTNNGDDPKLLEKMDKAQE